MVRASLPLPSVLLRYRLESIVTEQITDSYKQERNCIRTLEVCYLRKEDTLYIYQLIVSDFVFSDDDNAMGMLLRKAAYLFDHLLVGVDGNGEVAKIMNIEQISDRWTEIKRAILIAGRGPCIRAFTEQIEICLATENQFIRFLKDDKMYGLYFGGYKNLFTVSGPVNPKDLLSPEQDRLKEYPVYIYQKDILIEGFLRKKDGNRTTRYSILRVG